MKQAKEIYLELKREAYFFELDFPLYLGNGQGAGELCMDYNEEDGYMLYGYERGNASVNLKQMIWKSSDMKFFYIFAGIWEWNLS